MTNIALALKKDASLTERLQGIVLMGGGYRGFNDKAEHNFKLDPEAARIVLQSGVPIKMVGYNVTQRCNFPLRELRELTAAHRQTPFVAALRTQIARHFWHSRKERRAAWRKNRKPKDQKWLAKPWTFLHDPLTVATLVNPELVTFETSTLFMRRDNGRLDPSPSPQSVPVTIEMAKTVAVGAFRKFLRSCFHEFFTTL